MSDSQNTPASTATPAQMFKRGWTMRDALQHIADEIKGQREVGNLSREGFDTKVYWAQIEGVAREALAADSTNCVASAGAVPQQQEANEPNPRIDRGDGGITLAIETGGFVNGYTIALTDERAAELAAQLLAKLPEMERTLAKIRASQHVSQRTLDMAVDFNAERAGVTLAQDASATGWKRTRWTSNTMAPASCRGPSRPTDG